DSEIMDARRRDVGARYSRPLFLLAILGPGIFLLAALLAPVLPRSSRPMEIVAGCASLSFIVSPLAALIAVMQDSSRRNWIALGLNVVMWSVILVATAIR
ncbi:MAG: hypothetical protein JNM94_14015, partial [Phycisphaerae bacterium]|nr:hypothetical protein [Phycisphaerae bacterium]